MLNYPIKFQPILKEKIWGGNKLKSVLEKETDGERVGEDGRAYSGDQGYGRIA